MLATPKGVPTPPPQGQNLVFLLRSPNLAKPGTDRRLDPPALLAVTAAPLAFGMIGDFPLRSAEEIPIPVFFQMFTSSLVFQGGLPPVFRRIFALCPAFQRWVGYLPTPERKAAHRGDSGFCCFFTVVVCTVSEVYFQLQTGISQVPQRLFRFSSSTAEEAKQYRCYTSGTAL